MRPVSWHHRWSIGGAPDDTTLFAVLSLAATREHVVVVDGGRRQLLGLSQRTGRVEWRTGSAGRGPGELGDGVQVSALAKGGFLLVDGSNRRLRRYSELGRLQHDVPFSLGSSPLGVCGDERQVLVSSMSKGREIVSLDSAGAQVGAWTLPWPSEPSIPLLARQTMLFADPASGRCMQAMTFGPHYAIWSGSRMIATGEWVEPIPVAAVEVRTGGAQRFASGARVSTLSGTAVSSHFVVLFRSPSRPKGRVLDAYDAHTGVYRLSIDPPVKADVVAIAGTSVIFAGASEEGGVFVASYTARPSVEALLGSSGAVGSSGRQPGLIKSPSDLPRARPFGQVEHR